MRQIAVEELVGHFDDVAQLTPAVEESLLRLNVRMEETPDADEAGPVRAAAVQLDDGGQYLLVAHVAHPERFIDVRAEVTVGSGHDAALRFIKAADVGDDDVRWIVPAAP